MTATVLCAAFSGKFAARSVGAFQALNARAARGKLKRKISKGEAMIERYTRPEMGRIWTLENRYRAWLAVEVAVCEAWAELGRVPAEAVKTIRDKADIDVERILTIEETTRHDVIAFLTSLEEKVGPEARFIHLGCTSSDIVDTANALLLVQAGELILKDLRALLETLEDLAAATRACSAWAAPTASTPSPPASA